MKLDKTSGKTTMAASMLLRVSVIMIILMVMSYRNGHVAAPVPLSVLPLWDVVSNDTRPCQFEDRNSSQAILLHGSASQMCSIQINVSQGYDARIEISGSTNSSHLFSLHIERQGELVNCKNKYVAFFRNNDTCAADLIHDEIQLHLQGTISVSVNAISSLQTVCQESNDNIFPSPNSNHLTPYCNRVKGYANQITCDVDNYGQCRLTFPSSCNVTIRHREAMLQCLNNGVLQIQDSLITYPIDTFVLDLSYNNIFHFEVNIQGRYGSIEPNFFFGIYMLKTLYVNNNKLTTLPKGLFQGCRVLDWLDLYDNQLVTLNEGVFSGLTSLTFLSLDNNMLTTLPGGLFRGLKVLENLDLNDNQLVTLNESAFIELTSLTFLYLQNNMLTTLPGGLFRGLKLLMFLLLNDNQLVTLNESIFNGLASLISLSLDSNMLTTLPGGLLRGLNFLVYLELSGNQLVTLNESIFNELTNMKYVRLYDNSLTTLPRGVFRGLSKLDQLYLYGNQLVTLNESTFIGLTSLTFLAMDDNKLTTLPSGLFRGLISLDFLSLAKNQLVTLDESIFEGLTSLTYLALDGNKLTTLPDGIFMELGNLLGLFLYENDIVNLNSDVFRYSNNLKILDIFQNQLKLLPHDIFHNVTNLEYLFLNDNRFKSLNVGLFDEIINLQVLNLSSNLIAHIDFDAFKYTVAVTYLDLSNNRLKECPNIKHFMNLRFLGLRSNMLTGINHDTLMTLSGHASLAVSQHEICECYVPFKDKCSASDKRSPYLTCDRLLSDTALVVLMWIIGINALFGNLTVLIWRQMNTKKYRVQVLLLSNLALSDSLMGVYMITVASADIYYGENFPMQSETWRTSVTCRIAGAFSIASTELSVFFLVLISIDRFIGIKYPYSYNKLGQRSTIVISLLVWVISLSLGAVPSILSGKNFKFYDNSHVCIGLPLALTKTYSSYRSSTFVKVDTGLSGRLFFYTPDTFTTQYRGFLHGLYFSTAVFLGLNGICYLIILSCYISILRAVMNSARQSGRTRDMDEQFRITSKVAVIVLTDFLCISPIIVLGILVQAGIVELPPSVYAWSVTFVLPINSAINPYLYTIAEIISSYRKKKMEPESQQTNGSP